MSGLIVGMEEERVKQNQTRGVKQIIYHIKMLINV